MKFILILFLTVLFQSQYSFVSGQDIAFTNTTFVGNVLSLHELPKEYEAWQMNTNKKRRCFVTRLGEVGIIVGGVAIATGFVLYYQKNNDQYGGEVILGFIGGGVTFVFGGGVLFLGGKIYEHLHPGRYAIIAKGNQIGLAYNF